MQEFGRIVSDSVHLKNENNIIESSTISLTKNNPGTEIIILLTALEVRCIRGIPTKTPPFEVKSGLSKGGVLVGHEMLQFFFACGAQKSM